MRWGSGTTAEGVAKTEAATSALTRAGLEKMGVTSDIACAWRDFYAKAVAEGKGGAQAVARLKMFSRALELLCQ